MKGFSSSRVPAPCLVAAAMAVGLALAMPAEAQQLKKITVQAGAPVPYIAFLPI